MDYVNAILIAYQIEMVFSIERTEIADFDLFYSHPTSSSFLIARNESDLDSFLGFHLKDLR